MLELQFAIGITADSRDAADKVDWPKYMTRAIAVNDKRTLITAKILISTFIILPSSMNIGI
jgi:hypothetical protein